MRFEHAKLAGLVLIRQERAADHRGHFARTFCEDEFTKEGLETRFVQWSASFNLKAGTVRGMHFQRSPHGETKLVRCTRGAVFDVVVDLRRTEPTYGQWLGFELSADNGNALYIPQGFAHGFQTLVDNTELTYAITPQFHVNSAAGIRWSDPLVNVIWPLPISVISERDERWPSLEGEPL